jgi:hypothetical protein
MKGIIAIYGTVSYAKCNTDTARAGVSEGAEGRAVGRGEVPAKGF